MFSPLSPLLAPPAPSSFPPLALSPLLSLDMEKAISDVLQTIRTELEAENREKKCTKLQFGTHKLLLKDRVSKWELCLIDSDNDQVKLASRKDDLEHALRALWESPDVTSNHIDGNGNSGTQGRTQVLFGTFPMPRVGTNVEIWDTEIGSWRSVDVIKTKKSSFDVKTATEDVSTFRLDSPHWRPMKHADDADDEEEEDEDANRKILGKRMMSLLQSAEGKARELDQETSVQRTATFKRLREEYEQEIDQDADDAAEKYSISVTRALSDARDAHPPDANVVRIRQKMQAVAKKYGELEQAMDSLQDSLRA